MRLFPCVALVAILSVYGVLAENSSYKKTESSDQLAIINQIQKCCESLNKLYGAFYKIKNIVAPNAQDTFSNHRQHDNDFFETILKGSVAKPILYFAKEASSLFEQINSNRISENIKASLPVLVKDFQKKLDVYKENLDILKSLLPNSASQVNIISAEIRELNKIKLEMISS